MHDFKYVGNELYCEEVPVKKITQEVGSPVYIYSSRTLKNHYYAFDTAFAEIPHIVCFAVKANSNLAILNLFAKEGSGADIVSGGELFRAIKAGVDPQKIVFAGIGKTEEEITYALNSNVLMFNVESPLELQKINEVAGKLGVKARIALRVNPDIDPKTHPYISTGLKKSKFGIGIKGALEEYQLASTLPNIEIVGIHKHIGSQITEVGPFVAALEKILNLIKQLRETGIDIKYIDAGGGLGIRYNEEEPPHPREFGAAIMPMLKDMGCTLIFEPGRVLVGNAGILVTKVLYLKTGETKNFVIVDAGMNDLIRPSLYDAFHKIIPVEEKQAKEITADVVGPICESGDFLAKDRKIPQPEPGDHLAVMSAGAYGFTMSSNYNSRPRVAEVMVEGDKYHVIRKRESYEDLVRGESLVNSK
ncbi:MAG: diaminopimelate decarboxylase [Nitrospirae bacterium]|nr:diaminopimelate decarboxylase [Nitrospirota bacterium]